MSAVEPIIESDAADLLALFSSAGEFVSPRSLSDYWLYARLFSSTCLCVRNDDGTPIAAVIAFVDQTPGKSEIYVQDVAVRVESRGRGLGQALMETLHQTASDLDINRIWLTSEGANTDAMALWGKMGYQNLPADYQVNGVWLTKDLKGKGKDRAIFEWAYRRNSGGR